MPAVSLLNNIPSLQVKRQLDRVGTELDTNYQRLSSGMRINRAADDAAGLSVSSMLNSDARVFTQGIRNVNDAISLLSLAEGALTELSSIGERLNELATQAANGVFSLPERQALNEEGEALVREYNRIISSTKFNERELFDPDTGELRIQAGYGLDGSVAFTLAEQLARNISDGTFQSRIALTPAMFDKEVRTEDLNGDGHMDIISIGDGSSWMKVILGCGDGTFQPGTNYNTGASTPSFDLADMNEDGVLDAIVGMGLNNAISVMLGNSNGTFKVAVTYSMAGNVNMVRTGDFNNDGFMDVAGGNAASSFVRLGNGNGTLRFSTYTGFRVDGGLTVGDFNGDNRDDYVALSPGGQMYINLSNGDGTFSANGTTALANGPFSLETADLNNDGYLDLVMADTLGPDLFIRIGNGDGTFGTPGSLYYFNAGTTTRRIDLADANSDGYLDIFAANYGSSSVSILIANGDGTFKAANNITVNANPEAVAAADFNEDGATDFVVVDNSTQMGAYISNTEQTTTMPFLNLTTQEDATEALDLIDAALERVYSELGAVGGFQSRMEVALSNLSSTRENYSAASSRITDVDIASEVAQMIRNQVLQKAATAIYAQANQTSELVLGLIQE